MATCISADGLFRKYYRNSFKTISTITPGIPKIPVIKALRTVKSNEMPKNKHKK